MTRLILVRHGQSDGNLRRAFLGHTDLDLSELGYSQADAVGRALANEHIDVIYASDLKRAYNTSLPTARAHSLDVIKTAALREVYAGEWENKLFTELIEEYPESYGNTWLNNIGMAHPDGGESVEQLRVRVCREIERIAQENQGKTVAIFTHATPIRAFCATLHGLIGSRMHELIWVSNASITRVEYENEKFTVTEYGSEEHLGQLITRLPKTV